MTVTVKLQLPPPKIFIGIPTGYTKEYCSLYMLGALRNLDYNPFCIKVVFAVTDEHNEETAEFIRRLKGLIANGNFQCNVEIITTTPTEEDYKKWHCYYYVIKNMEALRQQFLNSDCEYFLILGGDNPPPRDTIKRLLRLKTDIASAIIYQRPIKDFIAGTSFPLVFTHYWHPIDLENNGLNNEQKRLLKIAWINFGFAHCVALEKNWRRIKVLHNATFGDGCCLVKREVLEKIPYACSEILYQSQDIQFIQSALAEGFETAVDMKLRCPHFCVDGKAY